jgi:hypothetical protein
MAGIVSYTYIMLGLTDKEMEIGKEALPDIQTTDRQKIFLQ